MKLLILLTVIACLQVSASGFGQTVTLSLQNAPIEHAFKEIKKQTGYSFVYIRAQIKNTSPLNIQVKDVALREVLDLCFHNQSLSYVIEGLYVIVQTKSSTPESKKQNFLIEIRGRVIDETGEPVAGATVNIKGTDNSTITHVDGMFFLSGVDTSDRLIITGAEIQSQEVFVSNRTFIIVNVRAKLGTLDETIVIAYGKTTRRKNIGSVSKISKEEISRQPVSNFLAAIPGRVSGLQISQNSGMPGTGFTVRLRGQNSIANGNDPLYIIDGIPYPSTTLNGIAGGGAQSTPLNNINISDIESIEVLKDAEATAIYGSRGANGVILITMRKGTQGKLRINARMAAGTGKATRFMDLLQTPDYIRMRKEAFANDGIIPTSSNARDLVLWDTTRNTDWQRVLIGNTMHSMDSKVELSGGSPTTQFLAGFTYHKESTVLPDDVFGEEKVVGQGSLNHTTEDGKIKLFLQSSFVRSNILLPQSDLTGSVVLAPNSPALYTETGELNWENSTWTNPLSALLKRYRSATDNILSNASLSYAVFKGFEAKLTFGYNLIMVREHSSIPIRSLDPGRTGVSSATFGSNQVHNLITEPQISYRFKISKASFNLLVGASLQNLRQRSLFQAGSGYSSDDLLNSIKGASIVTISNETDIHYRYAGYFGRIVADWDGKYLLSLTGRRDGSSRYAPISRFANFGSAGIGWIFSRESFWKNIGFLNYGKLRTSIGVTGNDQIGDYRYLDLYTAFSNPYQGTIAFQPAQLFSPFYTWERVLKREAGIDLGFFKEKLVLSANYYSNVTDNQLVSYALPTMTGFPGILQNLPAKVRNYGWELEMNAKLITNRLFSWGASFNISFPRNKLVAFENIESSTYANSYIIGQPLFISKRYRLTGVDPATGTYTFYDFNNDGLINAPADRQEIVFTGQQYYGGMQHNFSWKKLTAGFLLQFVRQRNAGTYLNFFARPGAFSNQPTLVLERWQESGDISSIQRFSFSNSVAVTAFNNFTTSNRGYDDASFIRLKNVYFSYQPIKDISGGIVKALSVFIQGQNLLTFTNYNGFDPETRSVMPPLRQFLAGIQIGL